MSVTVQETSGGVFTVRRPTVTPTWVDRNGGFVIRPVLADLAGPALADPDARQLNASLERTAAVVGEFIVAG